jgi:hypothetical protein
MARYPDIVGKEAIIDIFESWNVRAFAVFSEKRCLHKCDTDAIERLSRICDTINPNNVYELVGYDQLPNKDLKGDNNTSILFQVYDNKGVQRADLGSVQIKPKTDFQVTMENILNNQNILMAKLLNEDEEAEEDIEEESEQEKFYAGLNGILPQVLPILLDYFKPKNG